MTITTGITSADVLTARFKSMVAGKDEGVTWTFIPTGQPSKSDPEGNYGYLGWKIVHAGQQYGSVERFTRGQESQPDFLSGSIDRLRRQITEWRAHLDQQAAA